MHKQNFIVASGIAAILLAGCGGGGSSTTTGSIAGSPGSEDIVISAGQSIVVPGYMSTNQNLLTAISWSVSPQDPSAPELLLSNDKCLVAQKTDHKFDGKAIDPNSKRTGNSDWSCDLGVVAPDIVAQDARYKLLLTGTDDLGNVTTNQKILKVTAGSRTPSNSGSAGKDFSVGIGTLAPLSCAGDPAYSYQWLITDNAGLPLELSAYRGQTSGFTAPAVESPKTVAISCRVDNGKNKIATGTVNVTITPTSVNALVAQISSGAAGKPGDSIPLSATAKWYDALGKDATGPLISYHWSIAADAPAGVLLLTNGGSTTQLFVPPSINKTTMIPVTLTATGGGKTSTSIRTVIVDPFGSLVPAVSPTAQVVSSGTPVAISATSGPNLYYKWTQISGPTVILAGGNTQKVSFIAPTVASQQSILLRVSIGYAPITTDEPGVYMLDAVATINP